MIKTTLIIFSIILIFIGCDKNDDNSTEIQDSIVGKWQYDKEIFYLDDGTQVELPPDQCLSMSTVEFLMNGTFNIVSYIDDNEDGICEQEPSNWEYADWAKTETEMYRFTSKIEGQEEEVSNLEINFPTNDIMIWVDDDDGVFEGEGFTGSEQYFIKVQ